jgi:outer membrane receptor for Fe3+-dicitrate
LLQGIDSLKNELKLVMKKSILILWAVLITGVVNAQEKGFLRGNILDGDAGDSMVGATVWVKEISGVGTTTDFDGNYSLPLAAGVYTVQISFISYQTLSFPNIEIKAGQVTKLDATLKSAAQELGIVEVVGETRKNSEVAMLMERKNATNVSDGLSAQAFRQVGDSDLSGAIKRVTGVTIQNGKYVYVRGLGDRYTVTTLNNMALPGLDPDVNSVQMDIFPTNVLENVAVYKTFSPDLYGDFAGGLVNVVTKKFPEEKTTQVGLGVTYVPSMHFNNDFILYDQGSLDWLAMDDGSRKLPFAPRTVIPDEVLVDPKLESLTRSFDQQLAAKSKTALPNGSFSFYHGNQINKESGLTLGYNAVFNYSNEHIFYSEFQSNDYLKENDSEDIELFNITARKGKVGKNNVMWSGLLSGSLKKKNTSLSLTILNTQTGEATAAQRTNQDFNQNVSLLKEDVLTYTQRRLSTGILNLEQRFGKVDVSLTSATNISRVYDPDFRETRISVTNGDTTLSPGTGAGIDRFWRDLNEFGQAVRLDIRIPIGEKLAIKTGALGQIKNREFEVFNYKHRRNNLNNIEIDPDWFLEEGSYWSSDPASENYRNGTYTIGNFQPSNSFSARQNVYSGYLMAEHPVFSLVKLVYGVRVEKADMFYTGVSQISTGPRYNDTKTLDEINFLPSLNVVYQLNEEMNLRFGASQTVARPSFKEKSIAQIYDPITKRTFIGNINLDQTEIINLDLRYEYFMGARDIFAISGFYKQFDGHIEMVSFATAPNNITPRNSGQANLIGAEVEFRKNLAGWFESKVLSRLFIGANVSIVQSQVDLKSVLVDQTGATEFELRQDNARVGETIKETRPMAGQSPYSINANLTYEIPESQTNITIAYNVQAEQLSVIASGRVPDVYTVPFHSLDLNAYRSFGKEQRSRLTLGVSNLLNEDRTLVYKSYKAEDQIYTTYKPGVGISISYGYTF